MNDKNIEIGLKTVGADAAANEISKVPEALEKVPDSAAQAEQGIDDLKAKLESLKREARELQDSPPADIGGGLEKQVDTIAMLQKAQVIAQLGSQLAQIGPKFNEMAESVRGFDKELADTLETTGQVVSKVGEAAGAIAMGFATGGPVGAAGAASVVAVKELAGAWVEMRQAQHNAEQAAAAADAYPQYLAKRRQFLAENKDDIDRLNSIRRENEALREQEDSFKRMIELRNQLANQAATAASQEVQLAKLKGGDVALAEANLIAATLKGDLDKLRGQMAGAQQALAMAANEELEAVGKLRAAQERVNAGLTDANTAGIAKLEETAKSAGEKQEVARENLNQLLATYDGAQQNIIRKAEISIEQKEKEYDGKISPAAARAFDSLFSTLSVELAKGPEQARATIATIQADAATVTTAATAKAQEVSSAIQAAATGSTQAISQVGQVAQETNNAMVLSISVARNQVTDALNQMTNNFSTALAQIAAAGIANANRIAGQQRQIDQLFARIR